jgi:hypothetical protein
MTLRSIPTLRTVVSVLRVSQVCQQLMYEVFMTVNDSKIRASTLACNVRNGFFVTAKI